ncbi:MAG: endonuclease/exonuclease/phosphatase family protein [Proteobacteria bacterium]|nr:endonuclease/exonuclease/phosphatase family protein [Pseudomonadota bacterium]
MSRPDALRIVSFNILEGLRPVKPRARERRNIDRTRSEAALSLIGELAPDILVLNEALFCRQHAGHMIDYGELFGFPYQAAALYDGAWGNAILSRHPIAKSEEMRIYNRSGLAALINGPGGRFTVASYHPHPHRYPENKALDFARMIGGITGPLILCGDLNCISPEDAIDRAQVVAAFERITPTAADTVDRMIESGKLVFGALAERGLADAIPPAGRRYSIPTDLLNADKASAVRIDHILVNPAIEVLSGEVVHSPHSNQASDHHPVMIEFRVR